MALNRDFMVGLVQSASHRCTAYCSLWLERSLANPCDIYGCCAVLSHLSPSQKPRRLLNHVWRFCHKTYLRKQFEPSCRFAALCRLHAVHRRHVKSDRGFGCNNRLETRTEWLQTTWHSSLGLACSSRTLAKSFLAGLQRARSLLGSSMHCSADCPSWSAERSQFHRGMKCAQMRLPFLNNLEAHLQLPTYVWIQFSCCY